MELTFIVCSYIEFHCLTCLLFLFPPVEIPWYDYYTDFDAKFRNSSNYASILLRNLRFIFYSGMFSRVEQIFIKNSSCAAVYPSPWLKITKLKKKKRSNYEGNDIKKNHKIFIWLKNDVFFVWLLVCPFELIWLQLYSCVDLIKLNVVHVVGDLAEYGQIKININSKSERSQSEIGHRIRAYDRQCDRMYGFGIFKAHVKLVMCMHIAYCTSSGFCFSHLLF